MKQIKRGWFQMLILAMAVPMIAAFLATGCASVNNSRDVTINQPITVPPIQIKTPGGSVDIGGSQNGAAPSSNSPNQSATSSIQQTDDGGSVERRGDCYIFRDKYGVPKRYQGCSSDVGVPSPTMPRNGRW